MKKLLLATALGVCTAPAMAAGTFAANHPLLTALKAGSATSGATSTVADLPLPPLQLGGSITLPGFGKASSPTLKPVTLPGLGTLTATYTNPGKGNGNAVLTGDLSIDPTSTKTPTVVTGNLTLPPKGGQVVADYSLTGAGFGKAATPVSKTVTLPALGSIALSYNNAGKGGALDASLDYTSPAPKM